MTNEASLHRPRINTVAVEKEALGSDGKQLLGTASRQPTKQPGSEQEVLSSLAVGPHIPQRPNEHKDRCEWAQSPPSLRQRLWTCAPALTLR